MRALLLVLALAVSGCATGQGVVATTPTDAQVQAIRQTAVRAADSVTLALRVLDETGRIMDDLPLDAATKDRYDCAILKVTGTAAPSATVITTCGGVPTTDAAPLTRILTSLGDVSTCPGLRSTLASAYGWLEPLVTQLQASDNQALRMAGATIGIALSLLQTGGASTCG